MTEKQRITTHLWFDKEAREAAERAVEIDPEAAYIIDTLAEVYFRLGQREDAIRTIKLAIEIDPESDYYKEQMERFRTEDLPDSGR